MKKFVLLCLFWPLLALANPAEDNSLSVERLWQLERIGTPVASADGSMIVAPVTRYDVPADQGHTRLWLFSADGKMQRPLTAEGMRASEATFSPDGKTLAFISQRHKDDAGQIYLLPLTSPGEAQRLTQVPTGVYGMKWVGEHLYFVSRIWPGKTWEEMSGELKANKEKKVSAWQWNALPYSQFDHWIDENRQAHVFRIPAKGGEVEAITQKIGIELPRSSQSASSYDIDAQERYIAFNANGSSNTVDPKIDLFLAAIGSDKADNITPDNQAPDANPSFSPDGKSLAFSRQRIQGFYADTARLMVYDLAKKTTRELTTEWDRSVNDFVWAADSKGFYASVDDAATRRLFYVDAKNGKPSAITKNTSFGSPVLAG
ncbi:MAG: S9 family peptidase, partial [Alishewanella sp.]|nr:S9 family peptidase [Alishewanella sp.]